MDAKQKVLLEAASKVAGGGASVFVLQAATEEADVLADRRAFLLDRDAWRVFDDALERPARDVAGLRKLLTMPTVLDGPQRGEQR